MNEITIHGNLTADPQLRFTGSDTPVVNFTVAVNRSRYDSQTGQWVDLKPVYQRVMAWRQLAENVAESLTTGMLVSVTGYLADDSWERAGETVRSVRLDAVDVSASLRFATVQSARAAGGTSAPATDSLSEPAAEPVAEAVAAGDGEDVTAPIGAGKDEAPATIGRGRRRVRQTVTDDQPGDGQAA